jgi:plastocyanin
MRGMLLFTLLSGAGATGLAAQGGLDRSPNVSGDWLVRPGTVQFNFLHRFVTSPGPVRKVSNFPTFLLATSLRRGTLIGVNYATNSTLAPAYPNEWEFFARARPLTQAGGFPVDVGGQIGYNLASKGVDGEVSLARQAGPLHLVAVTRALSDPLTKGGSPQFALGGGAAVKLTRHLGLQGDYVRLTRLNAAAGEQPAWSVGLVVAIPNTPHTLSFHMTNTNTVTLQGASRGAKLRRYGFEFTIPITLARYFGRKPAPAAPPVATPGAPAPVAPGQVPTGPVTGVVSKTLIQGLQFAAATLEIAVGTTIEWKNEDPVPHTVTADDASFDSGMIENGQVWRYTFTRAGSYAFHCTPHPFMKATVVVK